MKILLGFRGCLGFSDPKQGITPSKTQQHNTTMTALINSTFSATGLTFHSATNTVWRAVSHSVTGTSQVELVGEPDDITDEEWAEIGLLELA